MARQAKAIREKQAIHDGGGLYGQYSLLPCQHQWRVSVLNMTLLEGQKAALVFHQQMRWGLIFAWGIWLSDSALAGWRRAGVSWRATLVNNIVDPGSKASPSRAKLLLRARKDAGTPFCSTRAESSIPPAILRKVLRHVPCLNKWLQQDHFAAPDSLLDALSSLHDVSQFGLVLLQPASYLPIRDLLRPLDLAPLPDRSGEAPQGIHPGSEQSQPQTRE